MPNYKPTDLFGLPALPNDPQIETARARIYRQAEVRRTAELTLSKLFGGLKSHLGVAEAWLVYDRFTKLSRPKSLSKSQNPWRDRRLLEIYDLELEAAPSEKAQLPKLIAERLDRTEEGRFGNSAAAIEKQIRRMLKAREAERKSRRMTQVAMRDTIVKSERALNKLRKKAKKTPK